MKRYLEIVLTVISTLCLPVSQAALPVVENVTSSQRSGTKLVDINYDVDDADGDTLKVRIEVSDDGGATYAVPAFSLTGDIGDSISPGTGKHVVWDAGTDWDGEYSDQMKVKVIVSDTKGLPGLEWGNEVPAGGFLMGQDGGAEGSGESRHVNIPWSYWLSKYEITNDQYAEYMNMALAAGEIYRDGDAVYGYSEAYGFLSSNGLLIELGDDLDIRWNVNKFEPVSGLEDRPVSVTWYGAMAFAAHYGYDLPTDAEWEKAARGPDHDDEGNFKGSDDPWDGFPYDSNNKTPVGYYDGDQTPIGSDMVNDYGLYDVIGNVNEWTRSVPDSVETYPQEESLEDARHNYANSSNYRVVRGGNYYDISSDTDLKVYNRETDRNKATYYSDNCYPGFRVIRREQP